MQLETKLLKNSVTKSTSLYVRKHASKQQVICTLADMTHGGMKDTNIALYVEYLEVLDLSLLTR